MVGIDQLARDMIALHDRWIGPLWGQAFSDATAGRWGAVSAENYVARADAWLVRAQRVTQAGASDPSPVIDQLGTLMDKVIWAKNYLVSRGYGLKSVAGAAGTGALEGLEAGFNDIDRFFSSLGRGIQGAAGAASDYSKYALPALVVAVLLWFLFR